MKPLLHVYMVLMNTKNLKSVNLASSKYTCPNDAHLLWRRNRLIQAISLPPNKQLSDPVCLHLSIGGPVRLRSRRLQLLFGAAAAVLRVSGEDPAPRLGAEVQQVERVGGEDAVLADHAGGPAAAAVLRGLQELVQRLGEHGGERAARRVVVVGKVQAAGELAVALQDALPPPPSFRAHRGTVCRRWGAAVGFVGRIALPSSRAVSL